MSELALMNKEAVVKTLETTENITHVDLDLDTDSKTNFWKKNEGPPIMAFAAQEYEMLSSGLADVARLVGIPESYVKRCPWELLSHHLNYWYSGGTKGKIRLFVKDENIVGASASRSEYFSNMQMMESIERSVGIQRVLGYHQVYTGLDYSTVSVVVDQKFEPMPGDMLYGGIRMQNSIIGEHKIEITPYVFRQICSNGAIVSENIGQWSHKNDDGSDLQSWVMNHTQSAFSALSNEFGRIRKLTEVKLGEKLDETLASMFRRFGIPVRTQKEIVDAAVASNNGKGPETAYDLWNNFTFVSSHSNKLSRISSASLMKTAGEISKHYSICPSCHQICMD